MALGKQAKILTPEQQRGVRRHLTTPGRRNVLRDLVMFLLSVKAGLRAKEIACLTWEMILDANGDIGETIELTNIASKGKKGGRSIPLHSDLREELIALWKHERAAGIKPHDHVIYSQMGSGLTPGTVHVWFARLYHELGLVGCSSHSGRRTFITTAARKAALAGGSVRDVQQMAGHANLNTTMRYIEGDTEVKRKLVSLL